MGEILISIKYETGNSFGKYIETDDVGCVWAHMDEAVAALKAIKEHHKYASSSKSRCEDVKGEYWYDKVYPIGCLYVLADGRPVKISAFWIGYFEKLIKAEIVADNSPTVYRP